MQSAYHHFDTLGLKKMDPGQLRTTVKDAYAFHCRAWFIGFDVMYVLTANYLSAGLIDIKTPYFETPEDIIERVRTCLEYRDAERLEISTDCGLRRVPRYLAISKMSAAAEAARRLRATG